MRPPPLRFEAQGTFAARAEALWPLVADTDKLNRLVGFPPMCYMALPRRGGGTRALLSWKWGEVTLARWDEMPFEWQYPHFYHVTRVYRWGWLGRWLGPISRMAGGMELTPQATAQGERTHVRVWADLTPRNTLGALLCRLLVGPLGVWGGVRQCRVFERYLQGEIDDPFPQLQPRRGLAALVPVPLRSTRARRVQRDERPEPVRGAAAAFPAGVGQRADGQPNGQTGSTAKSDNEPAQAGDGPGVWSRLAGTTGRPELVARLRDVLRTAPDAEVAHLRPFELADRWGADRRQVLALCLRATLAGVLEMRWEVLCPNCRATKESHRTLAAVAAQVHCETCNVAYETRFDRNIEVRFAASAAIRRVPEQCYCVGGPRNTPHIHARLTLDPGTAAPLAVRLTPGAYELRSLQVARRVAIEVVGPEVGGSAAAPPDGSSAAAGAARTIEMTERAVTPERLRLATGEAHFTIVNRTQVAITVELAERAWPETAATAALVSTLQDFRDLFSSEVLAPGVELAVQRLTFLFTDLTGSTALYEAAGQTHAFRIVRDHFRILGQAVTDHNGAVVKTIGDAVMATFATPADALRAAIAIQQRILALDTREAGEAADATRIVKVGVHDGPCLAVTANERLDYFGTTVNVAARTESTCRPGEITLTESVRDDPEVAALLATADLEEDCVTFHGIAQPVRLYRIPVPRRLGGAPAQDPGLSTTLVQLASPGRSD